MEIPRHWRMKAQRYRLEGSICRGCGRPSFPPRPLCARCASQLAQAGGWDLAGSSRSLRVAGLDPSARLPITERIPG